MVQRKYCCILWKAFWLIHLTHTACCLATVWLMQQAIHSRMHQEGVEGAAGEATGVARDLGQGGGCAHGRDGSSQSDMEANSAEVLQAAMARVDT
jgi:hypothetical protein